MRYLHARVADAIARVANAARRRSASDPRPGDPFRGLYLSREHVDELIRAGEPGPGQPATASPAEADLPEADLPEADLPEEAEADEAEAGGHTVRLRRLARVFGLTAYDVDVLVLALCPDLDRRVEQLYGYLNNDVSRRRLSVGLALELTGREATDAAARGGLGRDGALVAGGLLTIEDGERPFLTRALRVPDRVAQHLLGDDHTGGQVADLTLEVPPLAGPDPASLARVLSGQARLGYLCEAGATGTALGAARAAFEHLGVRALVVDLERLSADADLDAVGRELVLEAKLSGAGIVAGPIEAVQQRGARAVRLLAELPWPVLLTGHSTWDPSWSRDVPVIAEVPALGAAERATLWLAALGERCPADVDPATATVGLALGPTQIVRAATAAAVQASLAGRPLVAADLRAGARAQNGTGLERVAQRTSPTVNLTDLVLPPGARGLLEELVARARWRERVLDDWGLRRNSRYGEGITALFAGPSGTGKTTGAEAVAGELGLDLYTVDLAMVVDKYIGETEKKLDRIFTEAERVNGVLFFDEADALFGKRSEVSDARDRYANVETAFLLQRMESFGGIAILATNLRSNMDEAFTRRLDVLVDFPAPDVDARLTLWIRMLGTAVPRADDLDLAFCAKAFELSGGNVRNIAVCAAYLAAAAGEPVSMAHLIRAVEREYHKLGRMCVEAEFGPWSYLLGK
jgi:hypothetical protein